MLHIKVFAIIFVFSSFKEQNVISVEEKNIITKKKKTTKRNDLRYGSKVALKYKKLEEMDPPSGLDEILQHASSISGTRASQT